MFGRGKGKEEGSSPSPKDAAAFLARPAVGEQLGTRPKLGDSRKPGEVSLFTALPGGERSPLGPAANLSEAVGGRLRGIRTVAAVDQGRKPMSFSDTDTKRIQTEAQLAIVHRRTSGPYTLGRKS